MNKMIDKLRRKLIRSLGGFDFPQPPPTYVYNTTIDPQILKSSCKYHCHRIPPAQYIVKDIAMHITEQLINDHYINYSIEHDGDYIFVNGKIMVINYAQDEGETKNVEAVMEKV